MENEIPKKLKESLKKQFYKMFDDVEGFKDFKMSVDEAKSYIQANEGKGWLTYPSFLNDTAEDHDLIDMLAQDDTDGALLIIALCVNNNPNFYAETEEWKKKTEDKKNKTKFSATRCESLRRHQMNILWNYGIMPAKVKGGKMTVKQILEFLNHIQFFSGSQFGNTTDEEKKIYANSIFYQLDVTSQREDYDDSNASLTRQEFQENFQRIAWLWPKKLKLLADFNANYPNIYKQCTTLFNNEKAVQDYKDKGNPKISLKADGNGVQIFEKLLKEATKDIKQNDLIANDLDLIKKGNGLKDSFSGHFDVTDLKVGAALVAAEEVDQLQYACHVYDENQNGNLEWDEIYKLFETVDVMKLKKFQKDGKLNKEALKAEFSQDIGNDGKIGYDFFISEYYNLFLMDIVEDGLKNENLFTDLELKELTREDMAKKTQQDNDLADLVFDMVPQQNPAAAFNFAKLIFNVADAEKHDFAFFKSQYKVFSTPLETTEFEFTETVKGMYKFFRTYAMPAPVVEKPVPATEVTPDATDAPNDNAEATNTAPTEAVPKVEEAPKASKKTLNRQVQDLAVVLLIALNTHVNELEMTTTTTDLYKKLKALATFKKVIVAAPKEEKPAQVPSINNCFGICGQDLF